MKGLALCVLFTFAVVAHGAVVGEWFPAKSGQSRGPCPGLNTLANHGYLNRSGRNIKPQDVLDAGEKAYGIVPKLLNVAVKQAVSLGLFENGGLNLANLANTHGKIEHDVSLTRQDKDLGSNSKKDMKLIEGLLATSSKKYLTKYDIAKWRNKRYADSKKRNPDVEWDLTTGGKAIVVAGLEATLIELIFGRSTGNLLERVALPRRIRKDWLRSFLVHERIPVHMGWKKQKIGFLGALKSGAFFITQALKGRAGVNNRARVASGFEKLDNFASVSLLAIKDFFKGKSD